MAIDASSNPFRQRIASHSRSISFALPDPESKPPRLPPRKEASSKKPSSTIHSYDDSSSSSLHSIASSSIYPPTSISTPSTLMQKSLVAARSARSCKPKEDYVYHVLRRSSDTSGSINGSPKASRRADPQADSLGPGRRRTLIAHVNKALKDSEESGPMPPPSRLSSAMESGKLADLARPYLARDPNVRQWSCVDLLSGTAKRKRYAMIILNQPITRKDVFLRAWDASEYGWAGVANQSGGLHYCADGGANRLFDIWNAEQRSA